MINWPTFTERGAESTSAVVVGLGAPGVGDDATVSTGGLAADVEPKNVLATPNSKAKQTPTAITEPATPEYRPWRAPFIGGAPS